MSGIVAGVQSGGCCCQPQGCTCSDPNRPGAIVDASLTAINIEAELNVMEAYLANGRLYGGCGPCPCGDANFTGVAAVWGREPNGPYYVYVVAGCIVDPDFTDGTECESVACRPGGCPCCPEYQISAGFGNQVLERPPLASPSVGWATVSRSVSDHAVGSWNWQARQVGHCDSASIPLPNARVRRFCPFPPVSFTNGLPGVDPNGAFVDGEGNYTGGNVGTCTAYAIASVSVPYADRCYYEARIQVVYKFQTYRADAIREAGGTLVEYGGDTYVYRKQCLTPYDTALGTYECVACDPTFTEGADQECGRIRSYSLLDITPPQTITVS